MSLKKRVERLEVKALPERPFLTVFEENGERWLAGEETDYRYSLGGAEVQYLTAEEFERLRREYQIILLRWVDTSEMENDDEQENEN